MFTVESLDDLLSLACLGDIGQGRGFTCLPADMFGNSLEVLNEPVCTIDLIEYGNFMILLAEANCSHNNIFTYVTQKLLREDPSDYFYYEDYYTPEITFHLITLDDNGEFVCQTGGEELADIFHKGYENPTLHPLSFHVSDLNDNSTYMHIDQNPHRY